MKNGMAVLLLAGLGLRTQVPVSPVQQGKLVWSDEFEQEGLPDEAKWSYDVGGSGWGNNELQYYTAHRLENTRVKKGILHIEARKESWEGRSYTSARLVTKGKGDWQYGKVEVRAKLPKGRGTWPAIWMLASNTPLRWPDDGEIDIMEHVGFDPGTIHGTIHCKKYNHIIGTQKAATRLVPDCSDAFHVYSLAWTRDTMTWAIDGKEFFSLPRLEGGYEGWPFDNRMHLLLNVAVGGNWGGQKGIDETIWPQTLEIDYVRVYQ